MSKTTFALDVPYTWAQGARFSADPIAFARQLHGLQTHKGYVAAEDVLEANTQPGTPLHDDLEWDDSVAAYQHRLDTTQRAIGSLRILPVDIRREERMTPVRAAIRFDTVNAAEDLDEAKEAHPRRYILIEGIMDREEHERKQRKEALDKVSFLVARLRSLPGCEDIVADLDAIIARFSN